ncbi:uncharacterized protein LOC129176769 isoform X2 [Dunckerocampus dactyliophorus]|uniref:uncharacterized protein LOC129176769 isoform X2 n=1 Tax=Dunckerocampus dactyliophorus TaxID=161453 RepID=UPI0024057959|nr:uncharacterized protein LOC129176769 isoform X2 [Dunckerocampus dactyliophorus]
MNCKRHVCRCSSASSAVSLLRGRAAMEEPAVQQDQIEASWEGGHDGGKAHWKNECSLSSILKHSCLLCWSSPREADVVETDERVVTKTAEITDLENAVAVENLELQEQQSDRKELEETLLKLEKHKEKLVQQIKAIRQLCYEESQQILSLQAEEVKRESQIEEYERELAIARWRLRKLKEEVKQAKRKMEEAGERNSPLQDSIRQSYEEILQEEHTLCSLSGGAVTPESQLDGSTSPADTTEDEPLPMRPWGRSQSLPAYADLIMVANSAPFCNNLADTREEVDNSGSSSPKMDESNLEDDPEEGDVIGEHERVKERSILNQLDFYQADPFAHCHVGHDLFNEDLFPKTDSSDAFTSDPFKGSDPFAADILFPESNVGSDEGAAVVCDEADTSLSCAENKASTGTQCFESEFPDEDSDIEISYSQEDLGATPGADDNHGFKPIQSSSEELGPEPIRGWHSQGRYSVESDPNGYELDLGISPPSDIEEHSLGSLAGECNNDATAKPEEAHTVSKLSDKAVLEPDRNGKKGKNESLNGNPGEATDWLSSIKDDPGNPSTPQNSADSNNLYSEPESQQANLSFELNYGLTSQSSFDPYGFKLSPEHSSHTLVDPNEAELSPVGSDQNLSFDPENYSAQEDPLNFYSYEYDITSSQMVQDSDPYGFKLSPEEENQEAPELCCQDNLEVLDLSRFDDKDEEEPFNYSNQEVLESVPCGNQEILDHRSNYNQGLLDAFTRRSQDGLQLSSLINTDNVELVSKENQEFLNLCSPENQEVVEHCRFRSDKELQQCENDNQELLESCSHANVELLEFPFPQNQEVLDLDNYVNQEVIENQEVLVLGSQENQNFSNNEKEDMIDFDNHDNQESLDLVKDEILSETNNNQCILEPDLKVSPTNNSSDSDVASEDLLGLDLSNTSVAQTLMDVSNISINQACSMSNDPARHNLLEGDLGSVFRAGGYIGCPDVADDLEPLNHRQVNTVAEPVRPVRPVRPPRPSLRAKEKAESPTQGIDLK